MLHFGINTFYDLFTEVLKNESNGPKDFLLTISDLFVPMISDEVSLQRFVESGVLAHWLEYAIVHARQDIRNTKNVRILSMSN